MPPIADDIRQRATRIKLACFDVDGTLTDGRLFFDEQGRESKAFHVLDGQGLVLLRRCGIEVALITARNSLVAQARGRDLGVQTFIHAKDKLAQVQQLCAQMQISLEQVAFMGDDLPDLATLRGVGLAIAPANAHHWVLPAVHWVTPRDAGHGAARDACDLLLQAQDKVEAILAHGEHP